MLNINEDSLRDLIHRRSRSIKGYGYTIETGMSLAGFIMALLSFDLNQLAFWKCVVLALFAVFYVFLFVHSFRYRYSDEAFYQDIVSLSDDHAFSLLVLMSQTRPGQFLLVRDRRWKTFLFPYLRTHKDGDEANVRRFVENVLKVGGYRIVKTKTQDITKVSVSANMKKSYRHTFYGIEFDSDKTPFAGKGAKINGVSYRWMSIDDMKCDKRIMSCNNETVTFIESNF